MQIQTSRGTVLGKKVNQLYCFQGIPYARAKRFCAPEKYTWDGVLECFDYGKKAPQIEKGQILLEAYSEESCLNLNVYTPDVDGSFPVLVEIHGGAFQNGSNQKMDPFHVIQNEKMVYVTINYRLGVFGYLYLGKDYPTSGNKGTLDQLAALEWIKENIQFFGGNPNIVTVLGSSAGAKSVGALMGTKNANELFSQAILISGAYQSVRSIDTANIITHKYLEILKIKDKKELEIFSSERLLEAQNILCQGSGSTCIFGPVSDDVVLPRDFYENIHKGHFWQGKAIIGSSLHEMVFFKLLDSNFMNHIEEICQGLFGKNADIAINEAKEITVEMDEKDAWIKVISDYMYRTYSYRMANMLTKNGSTIYQYTTKIAPAFHVLDHILSLEPRDKLYRYYSNHENIKEIILLGNQIRKAYINFVIYGSPQMEGWNPLNEANVQMVWDIPTEVRTIENNEVCNRFGDAVYIL